MKVDDIVRVKGSDVVTCSPQTLVSEIVKSLADHRIGAIVVLEGGRIAGLISERDIVTGLAEHGAAILEQPATALMTGSVVTASPQEDVTELAAAMTTNRVRHTPVVVSDELYAIVSIGDVVKARLDELSSDLGYLQAYITAGTT